MHAISSTTGKTPLALIKPPANINRPPPSVWYYKITYITEGGWWNAGTYTMLPMIGGGWNGGIVDPFNPALIYEVEIDATATIGKIAHSGQVFTFPAINWQQWTATFFVGAWQTNLITFSLVP